MSIQEVGKYRQFFDVDEKYFPCIDDSAIEAGAPWENTYPHETFIELLKNVETMLGGTTKRSVGFMVHMELVSRNVLMP